MMPPASAPRAAAAAVGASAPELAAFQDEPLQMKSGTAGKTGFLRLGFEQRGRRTILANLERRAPYMAQRALYCDQEMPDLAYVFLITTTGCLLQGDRLALDVMLGSRAQAHVTTQSATKIHTMDANYAAQTQTITLADDAYLEFLPDPIIPHRRARFVSDTTNLHRSDRDAALFGDHPSRPKTSSSRRVLRRYRDVDIDHRRTPRRPHVVQREAGDRAAAKSDASNGRDGLIRRVRQCHPVHAQGQSRSHL